MSKTSAEGKPCANWFCQNLAAQNRTVCHTCHRRRTAEINPIGYTFDLLRQNAKRRGVKFLLTLGDFVEFLTLYPEYMFKKGRKKADLTIDRKVAKLGYVRGNLQVLPNGENARKGQREKWAGKYNHEESKQKAGTPF